MAFHRWASGGSAGLSRHVMASILSAAAATAPRITRSTTIQVTGGCFLSLQPHAGILAGRGHEPILPYPTRLPEAAFA